MEQQHFGTHEMLKTDDAAAAAAGVPDSLLAEQFCQVYYDGADRSACPALRDQVVANHARALLALGGRVIKCRPPSARAQIYTRS